MLNGDKHFTRGAAVGQVRSEVAALVLAAGQSRRFGGTKLLASFRGRPLAAHTFGTIAAARESGLLARATAVVATGEEAVGRLAHDADLETVLNDDPGAGLGRSLRLGLDHLAQTEACAALILLADQPLVRLAVLEILVGAWQVGNAVVVRPRYEGDPDAPGHPVLLDRSAWWLRHRLLGDAGLSSLLGMIETPPELVMVAGRNPDVDTPADLKALEGYA
jgi:CTP:molybdopterin cytidylyltransferase MocA